jgi:hypothetical protein
LSPANARRRPLVLDSPLILPEFYNILRRCSINKVPNLCLPLHSPCTFFQLLDGWKQIIEHVGIVLCQRVGRRRAGRLSNKSGRKNAGSRVGDFFHGLLEPLDMLLNGRHDLFDRVGRKAGRMAMKEESAGIVSASLEIWRMLNSQDPKQGGTCSSG